MNSGDAVIRWLIFGLLILGALAWFVSGLRTSVAGRWRDGDRLIVLRQWGPWVWGQSERPGGKELYRGRARFGRLRLWRFARGEVLLKEMGFSPEQIPLLRGRALARFDLSLEQGQLKGTFTGHRIRFDTTHAKVESVHALEPSPRSWLRDLS